MSCLNNTELNKLDGITKKYVDCSIAGLNGAIGFHTPILVSNGVYNQSIGAVAKTTIAGVAGRLDLMPYIPAVSHTSVDLSIDCSTLVASSNARILVYSNVNGAPGTKLVESTNLSCATTGIKTFVVGTTFTMGQRYWIGVHWSSTQTLRAIPLANLLSLGTPAATGTTQYSLYRLSVTFGSAPATYSGGTITSSIGPEVRITIGTLG